MRQLIKYLTLAAILSVYAHAQLGNMFLVQFPGVPMGACNTNQFAQNSLTGDIYFCKLGAWSLAGTMSALLTAGIIPEATGSSSIGNSSPQLDLTTNPGALTYAGPLDASSFVATGTNAGEIDLLQGTLGSPQANSFGWAANASIPTAWQYIVPSAPATGIFGGTASGSVETGSFFPLEGTGSKVQMTNAGATTNGHVVTYDANGNTQDSGVAVGTGTTTVNGVSCSLGSSCFINDILQLANQSPTGTTAGKLVKQGVSGNATITSTSDTSGALGVCSTIGGGTCGTTGTAMILRSGLINCTFDNATTLGDWVQISSTLSGDCHDVGSTYPTSGQILGFVVGTSGSTIVAWNNGTVIGTGAGSAINSILAATGANGGINNGNFEQQFNWQLTGSTPGFFIGENAASTGTGAIFTSQTISGSTAQAALFSDSLSGSQAGPPAAQVNCTWSTTGAVTGCFNIVVTNTASGSTSYPFQIFAGASGTSQEFAVDKIGTVYSAVGMQGASTTQNLTLSGGSGTANLNNTVGGIWLQGSGNSSNGASVQTGFAILQAGGASNASPNAAAIEGSVELVSSYVKGSAVANVGDLVCGAATAVNATDCPIAGSFEILGIATNTVNPVTTITHGTAPVKTDNTAAVGDNICYGTTTAGLSHDNGTAPCSGPTIGTVIAVSGTPKFAQGNTVPTGIALSTTLPMVELHISIPTAPTKTIKKGSGSGNYTSASTSLTAVDGTNLTYTVTIPTGYKLAVTSTGAVTTATAVATASVQLFDGTCGTGTALQETQSVPTATGNPESWALTDLITGDGASHTINLCYATSNASDSVTMINTSAALSPRMLMVLEPSN